MPNRHFAAKADARTIPVTIIATDHFAEWRAKADGALSAWVGSTGFKAKSGAVSLVAAKDGSLGRVLLGVDADARYEPFGRMAEQLPPGRYRLDGKPGKRMAEDACLGWAMGRYRFDRYKRQHGGGPSKPDTILAWPDSADRAAVLRAAEATYLVRDLINTPAADMAPSDLAAAARAVARAHDARVHVTVGDKLVAGNYPLIHAVGRAAQDAPRLIDLRWGRAGAPKVTVIGKGVCFDTGGLDLKNAGGMLTMKKDMGGAAHALALGQMIMAANLKVRLRVLVPAVENAVAGNAYHPLDVIKSRKGITVEIGNTDAEGRLILSDALTEACREKPDLVIDFATLTGAARVALGHELPALFCNDDALAAELIAAGTEAHDPLWRLPLWRPYRSMLDSKVADINNVGREGAGGAITAALFLQEFVDDGIKWAHLDLMGWNARSRPGHPVGGEAMGLRAAFTAISKRFAR